MPKPNKSAKSVAATATPPVSATRAPTASALACSALGLEAQGQPHEGAPAACDFCGVAIHAGDLCSPVTTSRSFFDFGAFPRSRSALACGHCAVVTRQEVLRHLQRAVVTADAIYNLNTDPARAGFWLDPPKPPFAVVLNKSTLGAFHYIWRTPVTLDARLVRVNVDDVVHGVNRAWVLAALDAARLLRERAHALAARDKEFGKLIAAGRANNPYRVLMRVAAPATLGVLAPWVEQLMTRVSGDERSALRRQVDALTRCGRGELLALSAFLKAKPLAAQAPPTLVVRGQPVAAEGVG